MFSNTVFLIRDVENNCCFFLPSRTLHLDLRISPSVLWLSISSISSLALLISFCISVVVHCRLLQLYRFCSRHFNFASNSVSVSEKFSCDLITADLPCDYLVSATHTGILLLIIIISLYDDEGSIKFNSISGGTGRTLAVVRQMLQNLLCTALRSYNTTWLCTRHVSRTASNRLPLNPKQWSLLFTKINSLWRHG